MVASLVDVSGAGTVAGAVAPRPVCGGAATDADALKVPDAGGAAAVLDGAPDGGNPAPGVAPGRVGPGNGGGGATLDPLPGLVSGFRSSALATASEPTGHDTG